MKSLFAAALFAVTATLFLAPSPARATDRFFRDITEVSPNGRFTLEAKSPDNAKAPDDGYRSRAFQASFVYTLKDKATGKVIWKRHQPMTPPETPNDFLFPKEGSPTQIFLADNGLTVIRSDWDEYIIVDITGKELGRVKFLDQALTKKEKAEFVSMSSAGPCWSGYALQYFIMHESSPYFVIRPWWGRRVFIDLTAAQVVNETPRLARAAENRERIDILANLKRGADAQTRYEKTKVRTRPESDCGCESDDALLAATYHAGRMGGKDAVPLLKILQRSDYTGSFTITSGDSASIPEGKANPYSYRTYTLRRLAHLSLRRLGRAPEELPIIEFDLIRRKGPSTPYLPKPRDMNRAANIGKLHAGMDTEQVLELLGAPDFIDSGSWEYDVDMIPSRTLVLKWKKGLIEAPEIILPARWSTGFSRDHEVIR